MEVYIPYIVGSSVSALIGKYAYNYIYSDSVVDTEIVAESVAESGAKSVTESVAESVAKSVTEKAIKETIDYNLLDTNLNETKVNSDASNNEKIQKLKNILKGECNRTIHSDFKKKNVRRKWVTMLKEYEKIGHDSFVKKWKK